MIYDGKTSISVRNEKREAFHLHTFGTLQLSAASNLNEGKLQFS
jgi:hypothetical protein